MTDAIQATFCSIRHVQGRKVYQLIFEIAQEQADHALAVLGGVPKSDDPTWAAIARLRLHAGPQTAPLPAAETPEAGAKVADKARRRFSEMSRSQQAALRCNDPQFQTWLFKQAGWSGYLPEKTPEAAASLVREMCGVTSRARLDDSPANGMTWDALDARYLRETGQMAEMR